MTESNWRKTDASIAKVLTVAQQFIGLPYQSLQDAANKHGWATVITVRDGAYRWFPGFSMRRINVSVKNEIVVSINGLG